MLFNILPAHIGRLFDEIERPAEIPRSIKERVVAFGADLVFVRHHAKDQAAFTRRNRAAKLCQVFSASRFNFGQGGSNACLGIFRNGRLSFGSAKGKN